MAGPRGAVMLSTISTCHPPPEAWRESVRAESGAVAFGVVRSLRVLLRWSRATAGAVEDAKAGGGQFHQLDPWSEALFGVVGAKLEEEAETFAERLLRFGEKREIGGGGWVGRDPAEGFVAMQARLIRPRDGSRRSDSDDNDAREIHQRIERIGTQTPLIKFYLRQNV